MKKLLIILICVSLVAITGVSYACYTCNYYRVCPDEYRNRLKEALENFDYKSLLENGYKKTKDTAAEFACVKDIYEKDDGGGHILMRVTFYHKNNGVYDDGFTVSDSSVIYSNPETGEYEDNYRKYSFRAVFKSNLIIISEVNSLGKPYLSVKELENNFVLAK